MDKAKDWLASAAKEPFGAAIDVALWIASAALGVWLVKVIGLWSLGLIGVI